VKRSDRVAISVHEIQRSLCHMSNLQEISSSEVYSENTRQQSLMFFNDLRQLENDNTDVDRLVDEFKQQCSM